MWSSDAPSVPWTARLRPFLPAGLRVGIGGLFLYAGAEKAADLTNAVLAVHGYALAPAVLVHPVALGLTLLEVGLGILLIVGLSTRSAAAGVAALTVMFLVVLAQAKARGLDISCGCFGGDGTGEGVSWFDIGRELPVVAVALYLAWKPATPLALDRVLVQGREAEREVKVAIPLVLLAGIVAAALVVPALTGALDLPQVAAPEQVRVAGPARSAPLPAGSSVPGFSAPGLWGGTVSWHDYQKVPVVLVVWAPWCVECREELPLLARVVVEFPGVKLLSVVTAAGELPGPTPEKFMRSHHLTFPVALDSGDDRLSDAFGVSGFPTVYYVRPGGTVAEMTVGAVPEAVLRPAVGAIAASTTEVSTWRSGMSQ